MTRRRLLASSAALVAAVLLAAWLLRPRLETPGTFGHPREPVTSRVAETSGVPGDSLEMKPPGDSRETPSPVNQPVRGDPGAAPTPQTRLRIRGRIVEMAGTGVGGAKFEVRAWSGKEPEVRWTTREGTATADGSFEILLDRSLATHGFGVETRAEGYVGGWKSVRLEDYDEAAGVEVSMERARAIEGRVVDEYGRGIPGSRVQLWYGSEFTWPTQADGEGRFKTPRRAPCSACELIVEAPRYPVRRVPLAGSTEETTTVGDIAFRRGGRIAGLVVDGDELPVPDVPLSLMGIAGDPGKAPRARSDGGGRFEFLDVGEGVVGVVVDGPAGYGGPPGARRFYRGGVDGVEVGRTDVRIVVRTETTVVLRFVDAATGEPVDVVRAEYGLRPEGTPEPDRLGHGVSSSAPVLNTRLSAWPGRYDLTVRSPGFEDAKVTGLEILDVRETVVDVLMRGKR